MKTHSIKIGAACGMALCVAFLMARCMTQSVISEGGNTTNTQSAVNVPSQSTQSTGSTQSAGSTQSTGIAANTVTEVILGSPGVSTTGAATYSIPLAVLPGTGGVQPALSIVYSSHAEDGLLGYGFRLSGLSSVARVATPYRDGGFKAVTLTDSDACALDGQLLHLAVSAPPECRRYYTEYENFMEITACNEIGYTDNDGRQYFTVTDKDGTVMEYGRTSDSRVVVTLSNGAKRILEWKLSKLTDPEGRYISYSYGTVNGEHVLQRIDYTGTSSFAPYNSVRFQYEARESGSGGFYYEAGKRMPRNSALLSSVKLVNDKGSTLLTYELGYEKDETQHRLTSLRQRTPDGTLLTTGFTWDRRQLPSGTATAPDNSVRKVYFADMDGDGLDEMVKLYDSNTAKIFKVNGLSTEHMGSVTLCAEAFPKISDLLLADVNGDGLSDMVVTTPLRLAIYMNMGSLNFTQRYERFNIGITGFAINGAESGKSNVCILVKKNDQELMNMLNGAVAAYPIDEVANITFVDSMITLAFNPDCSGSYRSYRQKVAGNIPSTVPASYLTNMSGLNARVIYRIVLFLAEQKNLHSKSAKSEVGTGAIGTLLR